MTPFQAYCMYLAIRSHFTQEKYDYFLYNGKVRASLESFESRKDKYQFHKLVKHYPNKQDLQDLLVANTIIGKRWVGDFLEPAAEEARRAFQGRRESFGYRFRSELENLSAPLGSLSDAFVIKSGQYPIIVIAYLNQTISPETFSVLNHYVQFVPKYDTALGKSDVIWSRARLVALKTLPFVEFDKEKTKQDLKKVINTC